MVTKFPILWTMWSWWDRKWPLIWSSLEWMAMLSATTQILPTIRWALSGPISKIIVYYMNPPIRIAWPQHNAYKKPRACFLTESIHFSAKIGMVEIVMCKRVRELLFIIVLNGGAIANSIYNERIGGDSCTYIHVCSIEVVPARSLVECAIKLTHADSGLMFYDAAEGKSSVSHPTEPDVHELARGQTFHTGGTLEFYDLSVIVIDIFTASLLETSTISISCPGSSFTNMV